MGKSHDATSRASHYTLHPSEIVEFPVLLQSLCDAGRRGTLVTLVVQGERQA